MTPRAQFFIYSGIIVGLWGNLFLQINSHYKFVETNTNINQVDNDTHDTNSNTSPYEILI